MKKYLPVLLFFTFNFLLPSTTVAQIISVRTICIGDTVVIKPSDFTCNNPINGFPSLVYDTARPIIVKYDSSTWHITIQGNDTGTSYVQNICNGATQKIQLNFVDCDSTQCLGPNLVPNPSIEDIEQCFEGRSWLTGTVKEWLDYPHLFGNYGDVDFFHPDCPQRYLNIYGFSLNKERARTGKGMIGAMVFFKTTYRDSIRKYDYIEFPAAKMTRPLKVGQRYRVRFYAKYPKHNFVNRNTFKFFDRIGAAFCVGEPNNVFKRLTSIGGQPIFNSYIFDYIGEPAKVVNPSGRYIRDSIYWTKIEGTFIADKPYTHAIFGNFGGGTNPNTDLCYVLYDDFSIQSIEDSIDFEFTRADTTVCKAQTALLNFKTYAAELTLKNLTTKQTQIVNPIPPLSISIPNVTQKTCYQLALAKYTCRDTVSFCVQNHPKTDTLLERVSCFFKDTGIVIRQLRNRWGCDSFVTTHTSYIRPLSISLGNDTVINIDARFQMQPILGDSVRSLQWQPPTGLSCATCLNPIAQPQQSTIYTLTAVGQNGCSNQAQRKIRVIDRSLIFVPSAFSPNEDGINETLPVYGRADKVQKILRFAVFNRWGTMVYERRDFLPNDESLAWDGRVKGILTEPDVFAYFVEYVLFNQKVEIVSGDVTLMR